MSEMNKHISSISFLIGRVDENGSKTLLKKNTKGKSHSYRQATGQLTSFLLIPMKFVDYVLLVRHGCQLLVGTENSTSLVEL